MAKKVAKFAGLARAKGAVRKQLAPPPRESVSEWAAKYRQLSSESSAVSGRWRNEKTPYLVKIMDAYNNARCREIVVQSGAQLGKTELLLNVIGFAIHRSPGPVLALFPNLTLAEVFSKDRIAPMIRDTKVLSDLVDDPRSRDSSNTIGHKSFVGGHLSITTCSSPANVSMRPCRDVIVDELDRAPRSSGTEGNAVDLAKKRSDTFYNRKLLCTSSPADTAATSQIHALYMKSKRHRYVCPCPGCGDEFEWKWEHMSWAGEKPETAFIECPACHAQIRDKDKTKLVRAGKWICDNPEEKDFRMGFKMSSLISPWVKFEDLVRKFLDARGDPHKMKVFCNTDLGECYEEETEGLQHSAIFSKREAYEHQAPEGVLVVTAGVDLGADNAQIEFIGWGVGEESWSLDYVRHYGNPALPSFWQELDDLLFRSFESHWGWPMPISAVCIDSGGHYTDETYQYVKDKRHRRIFAVKGIAGWGKPVVAHVSKRRAGGRDKGRPCDLISLCVSEAKASIYQRLKLAEGPGACHFPISDNHDHDFFKMLVAEEIRTIFRNGYPERQWFLPEHRRCEALDCRVYGYAALKMLNADFEAIRARYSARRSHKEKAEDEAAESEKPVLQEIRAPIIKKTPSWLTDFGGFHG